MGVDTLLSVEAHFLAALGQTRAHLGTVVTKNVVGLERLNILVQNVRNQGGEGIGFVLLLVTRLLIWIGFKRRCPFLAEDPIGLHDVPEHHTRSSDHGLLSHRPRELLEEVIT